MTKYVLGLALGLALTLSFAVIGTAEEKKDKKVDLDVLKARNATLDLVKALEDKKGDKVVEGKVATIKKDGHELDALMKIYKPLESGGIGFAGKEGKENGIEATIIRLQRTERGPSVATLKKEGKDIIKLAYINIAMAEIAKPYFNKPSEGKGKKDWDKWLDDQKAAAQDLIKAVEKEDSKAVAKAARALLAACTDCHSPFRK
jgi:hypothetical protein